MVFNVRLIFLGRFFERSGILFPRTFFNLENKAVEEVCGSERTFGPNATENHAPTVVIQITTIRNNTNSFIGFIFNNNQGYSFA